MRMEVSGIPGFPKRPANPPAGKLLLSRTPGTNLLTITWPDGQNRTVMYDKEGDIKLIRLGIAKERLEKLLNYVWNFYHAYVESDSVGPPAPVVVNVPRPITPVQVKA